MVFGPHFTRIVCDTSNLFQKNSRRHTSVETCH